MIDLKIKLDTFSIMWKKIKRLLSFFIDQLILVYNELVSFSLEHIFEYLHFRFPNNKTVHLLFYFFKDHCPLRAAALSFYIITYMVSGIFLLIFLARLFSLNFAESVIQYIINLILPPQISPTTEYIIGFTNEVLRNNNYIYIASVIAIYNMYVLLLEIKENFDQILDHYYSKSGGTFFRNQLLKIFAFFGFIVVFHFFIQPVLSSVQDISFGAIIIKHVFIFIVLWLLFNHSSNRINLKLTLKAALISSILLFFLEYLIFSVLASKHTFFGSERHNSGWGIVFLFPFWVYLAWNFIFIGLEYIATFTKQDSSHYPIEYQQYLKFAILSLLYRHGELKNSFICKKFHINYRYYREQILHRFVNDKIVLYDRRNDLIRGTENWEKQAIAHFFNLNHFLINLKDISLINVFHKLSNDEKENISFEQFFTVHISEIKINKKEGIFDKIKNIIVEK